jgi:DNA-binding XRE family transcriptional regulator
MKDKLKEELFARLTSELGRLEENYSGQIDKLVCASSMRKYKHSMFIDGRCVYSLIGPWPSDTPNPLTLRDAISIVSACREEMAEQQAELVHNAIKTVISPELVDAVAGRKWLAARWPWLSYAGLRTIQWTPPHHEAWFCLDVLSSIGVSAKESMRGWPAEVSPQEVSCWLSQHCTNPKSENLASVVEGSVREGTFILAYFDNNPRLWIPGAGVALLCMAWMDIERGRRTPFIAIDAGNTHHQMIYGMKDLPKDTRRGAKRPAFDTIDGGLRVELIRPDSKKGGAQLSLPLDGDPQEQLVNTIREWRGWEGLRHWTALQKQFSVQGKRQGSVVWSLDAHLESMGYSERSKRDPEVRKRAAREVELFTRLELAVYDKRGNQERVRMPVIQAEGKRDTRSGDDWVMQGMVFRINEALYNGVRDPNTGRLGKNWYPAPVGLAAVDHARHPHTYALGLILPIRWRWAWKDGKDHLKLNGGKLLQLSGIQYSKRKSGESWAKLERDLTELRRINGIGHWEWESTTLRHTLNGTVSLYPPAWAVDMTIHRLQPIESHAPSLPSTGDEFRRWRQIQNLSQAEAAKLLGVSARTVIRAEQSGGLPPRVKKALSNT